MIHVVVAVIQRNDGQFFVCQRQAHQSFSGYWEFPGGKQEVNEPERIAMQRELAEELGIRADEMIPIMSIPTVQAGQALCLHIWHITQWTGQIHGAEGQSCAWVSLDVLSQLLLPPANAVVIDALVAGDFGLCVSN